MMVLQLINQLTDNEDHRQDLWVAYLSGSPTESLPFVLSQSQISDEIFSFSKQATQNILDNPPLESFLSNFSNTERIIMCLLVLGYDLGIISRYIGISKVRLQRIVVAIRERKAWNNYGS